MIGRDKIQFILFPILLSSPLSYFFKVFFLTLILEKVNFNIKFLYFKIVN